MWVKDKRGDWWNLSLATCISPISEHHAIGVHFVGYPEEDFETILLDKEAYGILMKVLETQSKAVKEVLNEYERDPEGN